MLRLDTKHDVPALQACSDTMMRARILEYGTGELQVCCDRLLRGVLLQEFPEFIAVNESDDALGRFGPKGRAN